MQNLSTRFEKDLIYSINIFTNSKNLKPLLNIHEYNFSNSYTKALVAIISSSHLFLNFTNDLYLNKLNKKYYFNSVEEKEIAKILLKKYKLKSQVFLKFKNFYKIKILFSYLTIHLLIFINKIISSSGKLKLKDFVFYVNQKKQIKQIKKLFPNKNDIYISRFYFFKKLHEIFQRRNNYFITSFKKNNYLYFQRIFINFFFIQLSVIIKKPKIILFFEGDDYKFELLNLLSKKLEFKTICIQNATDIEEFTKAGFHNMNHYKYYTWGNVYSDLFNKISPNVKTKVVGNFLIDNKSKKKEYIGIILQKKNNKVSEKLNKNFLKFINWLVENYEKNIIIRPHPLDHKNFYNIEEITKNKKIVIHNPIDFSIGETLSKCKIIVTIYSSTIVEAASLGVIPLIFNDFAKFEKSVSKLKKFNPSLITGSFENAKKIIILLEKDQHKFDLIKKKLLINFRQHINYFGKNALKIIKKDIEKELI